jgi:hypothetical protein
MRSIQTLQEFKELAQAGFDNNDNLLGEFGKVDSAQLKACLIESNSPLDKIPSPIGAWHKLENTNWYVSRDGGYHNSLFLDASRNRVWILYSLIDADRTKSIIDDWIKNKDLDKCWLSRPQLLHWGELESNWMERGLGIKFTDGLTPDESASNVSVKAWHGTNPNIQGIFEMLKEAKTHFAISSVRWQKRTDNRVDITAEWYSDGRVTVNRAIDIDEVLIWIGEMANKYEDSLVKATDLRDSKMAPFEIDFSQKINLEAFSDVVSNGKGDMNLWLIETEHYDDFRRFKGIDLHTWDRILLDVGLDYAYLTVPGKGCVNAAPRLAVVQGEDNAGVASIYHDGSEVFT